jgi:predicted transcriptional regulator
VGSNFGDARSHTRRILRDLVDKIISTHELFKKIAQWRYYYLKSQSKLGSNFGNARSHTRRILRDLVDKIISIHEPFKKIAQWCIYYFNSF